MTEEISHYDEQLIELTQEIDKGIESLRKLNGAAKNERINELGNRMQRAKTVLQSFKVEMRELPRDQNEIYNLKAKEHHETLQKLQGDLKWAKTENDRGALGVRNVDEMTSVEIIQEAAKVQDSSLGAVGRMKAQIADTKQIGNETAAQLKAQTEQLKQIDQDIMKVQGNLNRADLLLRAFMRRMMTDKIVMVFMCLIFCGVIGIVVYKFIDPQGAEDSGINVPDQLVDPLQQNQRQLLLGG